MNQGPGEAGGARAERRAKRWLRRRFLAWRTGCGRVVVAAVAAAVAGPWASVAHAHGGKVFGTRGVVAAPPGQPGAARAPLLVPLSAGALVRATPEAAFAWLCPDALVGPTADLTAAAVTGAGSLLLGNAGAGLLLSDDWGCSWRRTGPFGGDQALSAVALSPNDPEAWYVASNAALDGHGTVFVTRDGGRSYRRLSLAAPQVFLTDIVATADALVAGGTNNQAVASAQLWISRDGGHDWRSVPLAGAPDATGEVKLFDLGRAGFAAAALDVARNAATVLLAPRPEGPWRVALGVGQPVRQVVAGDDGKTVLVGGTTHVALSRDGGATFVVPARPQNNGCAGLSPEGLWTCGDNGAAPDSGDGFALATLSTTGDGWTPRLTYSQLTAPVHCASQAPTSARCLADWPEAAQRFGARAARPANVPTLPRPVVHGGSTGCAAARVGRAEPWWQCGLGQTLAALTTWWALRAPKPRGPTWARALRRSTRPRRRVRTRRG